MRGMFDTLKATICEDFPYMNDVFSFFFISGLLVFGNFVLSIQNFVLTYRKILHCKYYFPLHNNVMDTYFYILYAAIGFLKSCVKTKIRHQ